RLVQGADQVVVAVLLLVVDRRAALRHLLQFRRVECLALARRSPHLLGERERRAAVAVGHADQGLARLGIEGKLLAFDPLGAGDELLERIGVERLGHPLTRARATRAARSARRMDSPWWRR